MKKAVAIMMSCMLLLSACSSGGATSSDNVNTTGDNASIDANIEASTGDDTVISIDKSTSENGNLVAQTAEAVIFIGEEWMNLRFKNIDPASFELNTHSDSLLYESYKYKEGKHYEIDYVNGKIRRTADSSIPDWKVNLAYKMPGEQTIDHTTVNSSNRPFTVYATYKFDDTTNTSYTELLQKLNADNGGMKPEILLNKIKAGGKIKYVVFGDSISTGAEASVPRFEYFNRFADKIRSMNTSLNVEVVNKAVGGQTSREGLGIINSVVEEAPDLVTIAYGMNDQNVVDEFRNSVSVETYTENIEEMIKALLPTGAQIILVTSIPANIAWKYCSGDDPIYAKALIELSKKYNLPVADVNTLCHYELAAGKGYETLLITNINHPGDWGHYLYLLALDSLLAE